MQYHLSPQIRHYSNPLMRPSADVNTSLGDIRREYTKALDEIDALKLEKDNLRAAFTRSLEERDQRISHKQADQSLRKSYVERSLIEAERRVLDLEEENQKLRETLDYDCERIENLEREVNAYEERMGKIEHIEVYNRHLQKEIKFLGREFDSISKRVGELDDEQTKKQITKAISVKYSQSYNSTLVKYVNFITKSIEGLAEDNPIRERFDELFPKNSNILKLVASSDYTNLLLKSLKLVIDLLAVNGDEAAPRNTKAVGSPKAVRSATTHNTSTRSIGGNSPSVHSTNSPSPKLNLQARKTQSNTSSASVLRTENDGYANNNFEAQQYRGPQPSHREHQAEQRSPKGSHSLNKYANRSVQSNQNNSSMIVHSGTAKNQIFSSPNSATSGNKQNVPGSGQLRSASSSQSSTIRTSESMGKQRPVAGHISKQSINDGRNNSVSHQRPDDHPEKIAAKYELLQRDKELLDKERALIEKTRDLMARAKEIHAKEQMGNDKKSFSKQGKLLSDDVMADNYRGQPNLSSPIDTIESAKFGGSTHESNVRGGHSKSGFRPNANGSNDGHSKSMHISLSGSSKPKTAKQLSDALREKSEHLTKVLSKGQSYDNGRNATNANSGYQEFPCDASPIRVNTKDRSAANFYKSFESEQSAWGKNNNNSKSRSQVADNRGNQRQQEEDRNPFGSHPGTDRSDGFEDPYYRSESQNFVPSNSNIGSYDSPVHAGRNGGRDYSNNRVDDYPYGHKKVSFGGNEDEEYEYDDEAPQEHNNLVQPHQHQQYDDQEGYQSGLVSPGRSLKAKEPPVGTQYCTFSVSFGRTESLERSNSPALKRDMYIMDVPPKKRVNHVHLNHNVMTADDKKKFAVLDKGALQYKVGERNEKSVEDGEDTRRRNSNTSGRIKKMQAKKKEITPKIC